MFLVAQAQCTPLELALWSLTGLFPAAPIFLAGTSTTGVITLFPTATPNPNSVLLEVQNQTPYDIDVTFLADGTQYLASVPLASADPNGQIRTYQLSMPTTLVTASTVNLNGLWEDPNTGQRMFFQNGQLLWFVDEHGVTSVFDPNFLSEPNTVYSINTVQRNIPANLITIFIGTDDPNAGANNLNGQIFGLSPNTTGSKLIGKSLVGFTDVLGNPVPGAPVTTLYHAFVKAFPSTIQAIHEVDKTPGTFTVVKQFDYTSSTILQVGSDYRIGDTIRFKVTSSSATWSHPIYMNP
jgi:hypothetical protein